MFRDDERTTTTHAAVGAAARCCVCEIELSDDETDDDEVYIDVQANQSLEDQMKLGNEWRVPPAGAGRWWVLIFQQRLPSNGPHLGQRVHVVGGVG